MMVTLCQGGDLPPLDPHKKVYQSIVPGVFGFGGVYREVSPLSAEELKKEWEDEFKRHNQRKMWDRGLFFLTIGLPLFFAGFFMSAVLAQYAGQMIAHLVSPMGLTFACTGASMMKLAEMWVLVSLGFALLLIYGIVSYIRRNKGLEIKNPFRKVLNGSEKHSRTDGRGCDKSI
jgi:hypothetical protein